MGRQMGQEHGLERIMMDLVLVKRNLLENRTYNWGRAGQTPHRTDIT